MAKYVPWNSQPLDEWAAKYAPGKFIDLNGRSTHYLEKGEGPPLILIHGFNYDSYTWSTNIDALANSYKVYAPDLWGLGFSTRQKLDYGYPLYVEQIRLFMDALGIDRASLAGHSMGGGTAICFSLQHEERVNKLVLLCSTGMPHEQPLRAKIFQLPILPELLMGLKTDFVRKKNIADFWILNRSLITAEYFEKATRFQKIAGTTEILLDILRQNFFHTLDQEIRQLGQKEIPTLIIWGRQDMSIPLRRGEEMHQLLKASTLEVLENAGHLANFDQSDKFNDLVINFLTD
jgi:pimeloyl-ACP methyl ester carboxylesterase